MALVSEHIEVDTRDRILEVAERLFRQIGYQKTTVGDIAKELRMSPANVYRFFESKRAIHEAVAYRIMGEIEQAATAIAERPLSASQRLRDLLMTIHHLNKKRHVGDSKLDELVAIAMQEDWKVCEAHLKFIGVTIGRVVADGIERGEFKAVDPMTTGRCVVSAMVSFFYPPFIAHSAERQPPSLGQMVDFVIGGISAPKACSYPRP
jgi:AcrR family transcriptional regulator